jgi:hypothetical protein
MDERSYHKILYAVVLLLWLDHKIPFDVNMMSGPVEYGPKIRDFRLLVNCLKILR